MIERQGEYIATLPVSDGPADLITVRTAVAAHLGEAVEVRPVGGNINGPTSPPEQSTTADEWEIVTG